MKRPAINTTKREIVDYWFSRIDECGLSVDASEAHERCWRCGCEKSLERCHIVPYSLGGKDEPSNFVLLCKRCHIDNPNLSDPEIMWDWIRAYGVPLYDTFWDLLGMREYKFIYKKDFFEEFIDIGITDTEEVRKIMDEYVPKIVKEAKHHYGHPYMNSATIAGTYRMIIKYVAKRYNKKLVDKRKLITKPWYCG